MSCACGNGSVWGKTTQQKGYPSWQQQGCDGDHNGLTDHRKQNTHKKKTRVESERWKKAYILWLKNIADHPVLAFPFAGRVRRFWEVVRRGLRHSSPGHQNHNTANVSDVRDGTQGTVHHCLLRGAEAITIITTDVIYVNRFTMTTSQRREAESTHTQHEDWLTCVSAFSTLTALVEINRSTSVIIWESSSWLFERNSMLFYVL